MSKRKFKRQKKKDLKRRSLASKHRSEIEDALSNLDILLQTGQMEEAEKVLDAIIVLKPDSLETLNILSNTAVRLNKLDTSIQLLQKACRVDPKDVDARYDLGIRLIQAEKFEEAETSPRKTSHWNQSVQLIKTPYGVNKGQEVFMTANHNSHFTSFLTQETAV